MELGNNTNILLALWSIIGRISFFVLLLVLAYVAWSGGFVIAAVIFLVLALGTAVLTVRKFFYEVNKREYMSIDIEV